jgi:sulfate transport system ATP-binding protein
VLLLDEPFGALDAKVRQDLRRWLRRLHDEIHVTSLFVTHDQEEALEVADRVVVMNKGRIEQEGAPDQVFHEPATSFVMNFLGNVNLFHARLKDGKPVPGTFIANPAAGLAPEDGRVRLFVRPHEFDLSSDSSDPRAIKGVIARMQLAGPVVKIELETKEGSAVNIEMPHTRFNELKLERGSDVYAIPQALRQFSSDYII